MTNTEDQARCKDDVRQKTNLQWPEACSICAGTGTAFGKTCVCRTRAKTCNGSQVHPESALPSEPIGAPVVAASRPTPSDSASVDTPELRRLALAYRVTRVPHEQAAYKDLIAHIKSLIAARVAGVRKDALEEAASMCETAEIPFDIDVWASSTKKEMTAKTARALAALVRTRIHSPATGSKEGDAA